MSNPAPTQPEAPSTATSLVDTSTLEAKVSSLHPPSFKDLDVSFFSHKNRRTTQLIGNTQESDSIQARREWYGYEFVRLLFVSRVEVHASGYEPHDEMDFSCIDAISGTEKFDGGRFVDGKFTVYPYRFTTGFGIRPPSKWLASPRITSIKVYGLEPSEFREMIESFDKLSELQEQVRQSSQAYVLKAENAQKQFEAIREDISDATHDANEIKATIESLSKEKNSLDEQLQTLRQEESSVQAKLNDRNGTLAQIEDQIEKKTEERKLLNSAVSEANTKLSALRRDIHLFPTEISGYVKQGARNIWLYLALCIVPFAVIAVVTYKLFANSENLLALFLDNPTVPIINYLISRFPYAVVSLAILTVCYTILHRLFAEIISINRRKQDLLKVSIIATDVSFASQHGIDLSEEQAYNLRTETKMELLKEHLRQHVSEDYVYSPSKTLLQRIMDVAGRQLESADEKEEATTPPAKE